MLKMNVLFDTGSLGMQPCQLEHFRIDVKT